MYSCPGGSASRPSYSRQEGDAVAPDPTAASSSFADLLQDSPALLHARTLAGHYVKDPDSLKGLADEASRKARRARPRRPPEENGTGEAGQGASEGPWAGDLWKSLTAMIRLIVAYRNESYRDIPVADLVVIVAAVIYFVMPFDAIPDWIPRGGYVDDALVVSLALRGAKDALDRFRAWEAEHGGPEPEPEPEPEPA